jgi:hypothetical protein
MNTHQRWRNINDLFTLVSMSLLGYAMWMDFFFPARVVLPWV